MNTERIFVREYLESLTEKNELNVIFTFLLEAMEFNILTKPSLNLGLKEYGKDIIAVGQDIDGKRRKFYFELKGGEERDITEQLITCNDGILDSLLNASVIDDHHSNPANSSLPVAVLIVHNGIVKGNASRVLDGTFAKVRTLRPDIKFDRWGIDELTDLFCKYLFGPYLLHDDSIRKKLNRVLINLDVIQDVSVDFKDLISSILNKNQWNSNKGRIPRTWKLVFETIKLIGFIIYRESNSNNNLGTAEKHLRQITIDFWFWILKNKLETKERVKQYFEEIYALYLHVVSDYIKRVLPIALKKEGLFYLNGGPFEQIGYTLRTHDFLTTFFIGLNNTNLIQDKKNEMVDLVSHLLEQNSVSRRSLLDIHSLSILDIILFFNKCGRDDLAIHHISEVFGYIKFGKETSNRMPDASNNPQNLVKFFATGVKPVYYIENTSLLLGMLIELSVVFNQEGLFLDIREFAIKHDIDLALFVPHHGLNSASLNLIQDTANDLEEILFSKSFQEGYQRDVPMYNENREKITFDEFKRWFNDCKNEFVYNYRTDDANLNTLRDLAHFHFKTPYFPDKWRNLVVVNH